MAIDINSGLGPLTQGGRKATERDAGVAPRSDKASRSGGEQVDSVRISDSANSLREMESRLEETESFDQAKVESIKQALAEGRYPVDSQRLAEKFLQLEDQINQ